MRQNAPVRVRLSYRPASLIGPVASMLWYDSKGLKKMTRKPERIGTPKSIPIAKGFRERKGTSDGIIVGEHIAKTWEANRTTGK